MSILNLNLKSNFPIDNFCPENILKSLQECHIENYESELIGTLSLNSILNNIRMKIVKCNFSIALYPKIGNKDEYQKELLYIKDILLPLCFHTLKNISYCNDTKLLFHDLIYECKDLLRHFSEDIKIKQYILEIENMLPSL